MHDYLVERGLRDASRITLVMPFGTPLPVSPEVGAAILAELTDRGIDFVGGATITGVDPSGRAVRLADGATIAADLILAVPLHVAPPVVVQSGSHRGRVDPGGQAHAADPVPGRLRVRRRRQRGGAPGRRLLRRAGQGGRGAAHRPASNPKRTAARYEGAGVCYLEFGRDKVGRVDVNFLGGPSVSAALQMPSRELRAEKTAFGATRTARWFGIDS